MAEKEVKLRKDGLPKVPLSLYEKIIIAVSIVLVIATIACGTLKFAFAQLENISTVITSSLTQKDEEKVKFDKSWLAIGNKFLPDSVELKNGDGVPFNVRLEFNTEFDFENVEGIMGYFNLFNVYDEKENLIPNEDKLTVGSRTITGSQLKIMALMAILEELTETKKVVNNVFIVLILLDIVVGILLAYIIWKRADDRRELRELQIRENEIKRVTGASEEEIKNRKKKKKKKK